MVGQERDQRVNELTGRISAVERQVRSLSTSSRLAHSSLEDGAITEYDENGRLVSRIGKQPDGTHGLYPISGPIPPIPSMPATEGGPGVATIIWGGTFVGGVPTPMDFESVEVYASREAFSYIELADLVGVIPNDDGGRITVALPVDTWHVALVAKSKAGRRSALSALVTVTVNSVLDSAVVEELEQKIAGIVPTTWSEREPAPADGDGKAVGAGWRQVDMETGAILGEWSWDGLGAWTARPIASNAIYSVDVGKLKASEAEIDEAVVSRLWVDLFAARKITAIEADLGSFAADSGFIADLRAGIVTATMFQGRSFTGGTFTGTTFRTSASWPRVQMDENGLRSYNANNANVVRIAADTGRIDTLERLVVGGGGKAGVALLPHGAVTTGSADGSTDIGVFLNPEATTIDGDSAGLFVLSPGATAKNATLRGYRGAGITIPSGGLTVASGGLDLTGTTTLRSGYTAYGSGTVTALTISGGDLYGQNQSAGSFGVSLYGETRLWSGSATSTLAANTYLSGDWRITKTSSSERYKDAIEPIPDEVALRLLDVVPVTWFDHNDSQRYAQYLERLHAFGPDPDPRELAGIEELRRIPGVTAEKMHAAGLHDFVVYARDPESGERRPESVMYDRIWVLLIPLVRKLVGRIGDLEKRLDALESLVSDAGR